MSTAEQAVGNPLKHARIERSVLVPIVGVVVLLVVGIALALIVTHHSETSYPPDSPQGTVARYLRLLQNGRADEAYKLTYFAIYDQAPMPPDDFENNVSNWAGRSHRVTLLQARTTGNTASIKVEISAFTGGVFGASDQTEQQTFTLVRRHGAWRITGPEYLYP